MNGNSDKQKMLQINISANHGSTGKIAEQIGRLAIADGWESYIAYGREAGESQSHLIHIGNMWDERWHGVQTRLFDRHGLASECATKKLVEKINVIQPDIIHLHNIHGYYLNYQILFDFLSEYGKPVVWTLHDCWSFTGHCAYFDAIGCEKWKTHCANCPLRGSYPSSFLIDGSSRNFELKKKYFNLPKNLTLVPVSHWLEKLLRQSFLGDHYINMIYNGIDLTNFRPYLAAKIHSAYGKTIVLGVASVWEKRKGLSDLIKLSEHDDLLVVLIGLNDSQLKNLPSNVIGLKRTSDQQELAEYYSSADVFVNPTYQDTFPTVNLEAMACGTPVVTYNTGGSPESLTEETGIVVPKGDVEGLYSEIKSIIGKSPAEKEEQRRLCVERAKEFDAKVRYEEYINLYEKLLSR